MRRLGPPCLRAFHSPSLSDFDASTIGKKVQRASAAAIRQANVQHILTATKGAKIRGCPVQPEQHLHRQASLDSGVAETVLSTALAVWRWHPDHLGIKPNRQRPSLLQTVIVRLPVSGLVLCWGPATHTSQL